MYPRHTRVLIFKKLPCRRVVPVLVFVFMLHST